MSVEERKIGPDNGETDKSHHPDIVFSPSTPEMLTSHETWQRQWHSALVPRLLCGRRGLDSLRFRLILDFT